MVGVTVNSVTAHNPKPPMDTCMDTLWIVLETKNGGKAK